MLKGFFRSVFTISFFTTISRIFGFVRDILIARYLGVSLYSDVFFAAFRLPNFFRRIFAEGAFNSAFIPIFVSKNNDISQSKIFVNNIFSLLFYILLIFILLVQLMMPSFMKIFFPGFLADSFKFGLLVDLSRITIFYLLFISLVSLMSAILNSKGNFAVPASAPIILNITLIFSLFFFGSLAPSYVHALSWGVFCAGVLQFVWLFIFTFKSGFLIYPKFPEINYDVKKFFKKIIPAIIGANVMQINLLIDSIFASMTISAVSYLYYADRVNQLPLALIGIAIGVVLLPRLSSYITAKKEQEAVIMQNLAIKVGILLVFPASIGLFLMAEDIIRVLFERGNFTKFDTLNVAKALSLYALALPAYVMVKVLEPSFFARGNTKIPMKIAIICLIINVILNFLFFKLGFGFVGIIIASICASYLNLLLIFNRLLAKKFFKFIDFGFFEFARLVMPTIFMATFLMICESSNVIDFFVTSSIVKLVLEIIIAIILYILLFISFGHIKLLKKFS